MFIGRNHNGSRGFILYGKEQFPVSIIQGRGLQQGRENQIRLFGGRGISRSLTKAKNNKSYKKAIGQNNEREVFVIHNIN